MRKQHGFTLVEIAIVLVIIGLLLGGILRGQELIQSARVRNVIDQQNGIRAAFFGFQDRFRLIPGDLTAAQAAQVGGSPAALAATSGTPGDGIIAAGDSGAAFQNLAVAGFISCTQCASATATGASTTANSPANVFGGVLQLVTDNAYYGGTPAAPAYPAGNAATFNRNNIKTGNSIASNIMREIDVKADDGSPVTGAFRFSQWTPAGSPAPSTAFCTFAAAGPPTAQSWQTSSVAANCGGASLL